MAFVGREEEVAIFDAALLGGGCSVLYVHGPGGIGKSALLRRFAREARLMGRLACKVDGRMMRPAAFEAADGLIFPDADAVLLIDDFDQVQGLEGWLRERFLPKVPVGMLVVIAGRLPPDLRWQADPGWAGALKVLPLRELPEEDAQALMDSTGVPAELREPLLAFAGGHPLALLLGAAVAVKDGGAGRRWTPNQDVVATLLDQLVGELPSAAHRHALEICAHAYMTTEDLLRAALPEDAGTLFGWLRRLPFVESSPSGLFPHDVVREVLEADLRWRDPEGYDVMHGRIHAHLTEKVRTASDKDVLGAVAALLYLGRDDHGRRPGLRACRGEGAFHEEALRQEDVGALLQVATAAEGAASARCATFWAERQLGAFRVYRRSDTGDPVAFSAWLRLADLDEEELAADPVVAAAWTHARATRPLRAGEQVSVCRVWALPGYCGNSSVMDVIQWRVIGNCLRAEQLAWSYIAMKHPAQEQVELLRHYGMHDIPEQPRLGSGAYTLFAHDWRTVPAQAWLEQLNNPRADVPSATELAVLSQAEFAEAVRKALRLLSRPDVLAASPLVRTRLITERTTGQDPATALGDLLRQAIEDLREDPRAVKFHRAVSVTFLSGTPTQELAAERLGLPFTTYRRHLTTGIERICAGLWHQELYGTSTPVT